MRKSMKLLAITLSITMVISCLTTSMSLIANAAQPSDIYSNGTMADSFDGSNYNASDYWVQAGNQPLSGTLSYYTAAQTVAATADGQLKVLGYGGSWETQGSLRLSMVKPQYWPAGRNVISASGKVKLYSNDTSWNVLSVLVYYYKDQYNWRGFAICGTAVRHIASFSKQITDTADPNYGKTYVYTQNSLSQKNFTAGTYDTSNLYDYSLTYASNGTSVTLLLTQNSTIVCSSFTVSRTLGNASYMRYVAEDVIANAADIRNPKYTVNPETSGLIDINTVLLNQTSSIALGSSSGGQYSLFDNYSVEFQKSANEFRALYADVLVLTISTVTSDNSARISAALSTYAALDPSVQTELSNEHALLIDLQGVLKYIGVKTDKYYKMDFEGTSPDTMETLSGTASNSIKTVSTYSTVGNSSTKCYSIGALNMVSAPSSMWSYATSNNLTLRSFSGKAYLDAGKTNQFSLVYYYKDSSNYALFTLNSASSTNTAEYSARFAYYKNGTRTDVSYALIGGVNVPVAIDNYNQAVGGKWINYNVVYNDDNTVTINFYTDNSLLMTLAAPVLADSGFVYNSGKVALADYGPGGQPLWLIVDDLNVCFGDNKSEAFKINNYYVLGMDENAVSPDDISGITAAATAYTALSDGSKAFLSSESTKLTTLQTAAGLWLTSDSETIASSFRTIYADVLNNASPAYARIMGAYKVYNRLDAAVKELLSSEKNTILTKLVSSGSTAAFNSSSDVINITCVGGAVTNGMSATAGYAYPLQLQTFLGTANYKVNYYASNYAKVVNSYTDATDYSSQLETTYMSMGNSSHFLESDVVIFMLGEADYTQIASNADKGAKYKTVLKRVLKSYLSLKNSPTVILVSNSITKDNNSQMNYMIGLQREVASELGISIIDFGALSASWQTPADYFLTTGTTYLLNDNGQTALATQVYNYLKYNVPVCTVASNEVLRTTSKATVVDVTVSDTVAKYSNVMVAPKPADVESVDNVNEIYNNAIVAVQAKMSTMVSSMNTAFGVYLPDMKGATFTIGSAKYVNGTLGFHTEFDTTKIPSGYKIVEYGTVMMRNALIESGAKLVKGYSNGTKASVTACKTGLAITTGTDVSEFYAYLKCAGTDEINVTGYHKTNYAARAYLVYEDSQGNRYTLYSSSTLVRKSDNIARTIASALVASEIASNLNYGQLTDAEKIAISTETDTTTDISKIWTFLVDNKAYLSIS